MAISDIPGSKAPSVPTYNEYAAYYAAGALSIAIVGVSMAVTATETPVIIASSILAFMATSVFSKIVAYEKEFAKAAKSLPSLEKNIVIGFGEGISATVGIITAIAIRMIIIV